MSIKQEGLIFASMVRLRLLIVVGSILIVLIATHPKDMIMVLGEGMSRSGIKWQMTFH